MEILDEWKYALREIDHVWTSPRSISVQWDAYKKRWAGPDSMKTYRILEERPWAPRRLTRYMRNPRKAWRAVAPGRWSSTIGIDVPLPSDVVLIPTSHTGLICASRQEGISLKLVPEERFIRREIDAWNVAKQAGIEAHVPTRRDYGSTRNGMHWMAAQLAPNTRSVGQPFDPTQNRGHEWRRWLRDRILPLLSAFYDASGVQIESIDDVLDNRKRQLQRDASLDPLQRVYQLATEAARKGTDTRVATAMVHGDLHSEHLHCHGEGWWLIDWGGARHTNVAIEIFIEYYRCRFREDRVTPFYNWLSGATPYGRLPRGLRADIDLYLTWQEDWKGIKGDEHSLRATLLCWILRRMINRVREKKELGHVLRGTRSANEAALGWYGWVLEELEALGVRQHTYQ